MTHAAGGDAPVLPGLTMDFPLTTALIARRMSAVHGASRVVTVHDESGATTERTFAEVVNRSAQLAGALAKLGVGVGDRVASYAWNTCEHLETYYAVMGMGAVLHTVNLRLHSSQIVFTINHAADRVIIVDSSLADALAEMLPELTTVEHIVVIGELPNEVNLGGALSYTELVDAEDADFTWPDLDERSAASLCYTSGTTGDPKGVLYSHRSIVLHALSMSGADAYGIDGRDRVLALVPLFHAMGWGLPFVCGLIGADLVMPGRFLQPAPLARVIADQKVTWSTGVPTLWMDLLHHVDQQEREGKSVDLSSIDTILSGGTQVGLELMRAYESRFDADLIQGWGMTEIFPGATVSRDQVVVDANGDPDDDARWSYRSAAGRLSPLYEARVVGTEGDVLPSDGRSVGEVEVRGPVVAGSYFRLENSADKFRDGWLRTGDVGTLDERGWLRISDRSKDAIKSGGEWISSIDLEIALMDHPSVREAAVIGRPDARWSERPVAFVVLDTEVTDEQLREHLSDRVAKWWIPEDFTVTDAIPRTSTGKFDKKVLRARLVGE